MGGRLEAVTLLLPRSAIQCSFSNTSRRKVYRLTLINKGRDVQLGGELREEVLLVNEDVAGQVLLHAEVLVGKALLEHAHLYSGRSRVLISEVTCGL